MNRRNFFKGAVSVMAMAAILKGRVDSGGFFVAMYEPETETWRDRTVFVMTNPPGDKTWVSTHLTTNMHSYPDPQKWA